MLFLKGGRIGSSPRSRSRVISTGEDFVIKTTTSGAVNFFAFLLPTVQIDWGDGSPLEVVPNGVNVPHVYADTSEKKVKLSGNVSGINAILINSQNWNGVFNANFPGNVLQSYSLKDNDFTEVINNRVGNIDTINLTDNPNLGSFTVVNAPLLATFDADNCGFPEEVVDSILSELVSHGLSGGSCDIAGASNAAPSAAGLASKAILVSRGWTVTHN